VTIIFIHIKNSKGEKCTNKDAKWDNLDSNNKGYMHFNTYHSVIYAKIVSREGIRIGVGT
jgi:hypothetical protein